MKTRFVCGVEITFKGDVKFAIDPMGIFDTVDDAVKANKRLHSSFGYAIYEVLPEPIVGLKRIFGIGMGSKCSGYRIVKKVCNAYDHHAW